MSARMLVGLGICCMAIACGSDDKAASPADPVVLTGTPDPATVFNAPQTCYFYANNLMSGIWHRASNRIIAGHYNEDGYYSHLAGAGGYPALPDNDTGTRYARIVHMPGTRTVVHAGVDQFPSAASTVFVGTTDDQTGALGSFAPAVFSDGFAGDCNLISSSATEFLCYDGAAVRHYATARGSAALTLSKTVALSQQPLETCGAFCFGGTFAWDGAYYYFSDDGNSSSNLVYAVYNAGGSFLANYTATGSGSVTSTYFDWSAGQYATHDGFGGRSGVDNFTWTGGSQGDDSQCYYPSAYHTAP